MPDDRHGCGTHFPEERRRIGEEEEVGVEIGDRADLLVTVEDEGREERRAGEVVLEWGAIALDLDEGRVRVLQFSQLNGPHLRQGEHFERLASSLVQAECPETESGARASQRANESERPAQVPIVEVGTELVHPALMWRDAPTRRSRRTPREPHLRRVGDEWAG